MQTVIALGTFDGMHAGHRQVLSRALEEAEKRNAKSMAYTFGTIPKALFEKAPVMLMTSEERKSEMLKMGVEEVVIVEFTQEFACKSPEAFVRELVNEYHPAAVVTGEDYTFGYRAQGNTETLKRLGREMGFDVVIVPTVRIRMADGTLGEKVSSTAIRNAMLMDRPDIAKAISEAKEA